jgi:WXG100 family type VII secretion target
VSSYKFDFNQADTTMYDMNVINTRIKSALSDMEASVERSLNEWTGSAKDQYYISKAKWNAAAQEMTAHFDQARQTLATIHENYGTTEQRHVKLWTV